MTFHWVIGCYCVLVVYLGSDLQYVANADTVPDTRATYSDFQRKHLIQPSVDSSYQRYNRQAWNNWLKNVTNDYGTARKRNSIVIADEEEIIKTFQLHENEFNATAQLYWSDHQFQIYQMQYVNESYDVFDCQGLYFVAALNFVAKPIHFHGSGETIGNMTTDTSNCRKVTENVPIPDCASSAHFKLFILILTVSFVANFI